MAKRRTEFDVAKDIAERVLDTPNRDPDDDESVLARQLLRQIEANARLNGIINEMETSMMIDANRDSILKKHEEAVIKIANLLRLNGKPVVFADGEKIAAILHALAIFHPMHGESWPGWPDEAKSPVGNETGTVRGLTSDN
jgi:hypothetical protein